MLIAAIDPLEGSLSVLLGSGLALAGALQARCRARRLLAWACVLSGAGVGLLWGISSIGGLGGGTGRSMWWALLILPYPAGWIMSLVGVIRSLRELSKRKA